MDTRQRLRTSACNYTYVSTISWVVGREGSPFDVSTVVVFGLAEGTSRVIIERCAGVLIRQKRHKAVSIVERPGHALHDDAADELGNGSKFSFVGGTSHERRPPERSRLYAFPDLVMLISKVEPPQLRLYEFSLFAHH